VPLLVECGSHLYYRRMLRTIAYLSIGCLVVGLCIARAASAAGAKADQPSDATKQALSSLEEGSIPLYVLGDLNEDGKVDKDDRKLLSQLMAARAKGLPTPPGVMCVAAGDLNLDRSVDQEDLAMLDSWLAKQSEVSPAALDYEPSLPCRLTGSFIASWLDPSPGQKIPLTLTRPDLTTRNVTATIKSGPGTIQSRADGKSYDLQVNDKAKPGDLIVVLFTLPNRREYALSLPISQPSPMQFPKHR
jgi:hypothetical protein